MENLSRTYKDKNRHVGQVCSPLPPTQPLDSPPPQIWINLDTALTNKLFFNDIPQTKVSKIVEYLCIMSHVM